MNETTIVDSVDVCSNLLPAAYGASFANDTETLYLIYNNALFTMQISDYCVVNLIGTLGISENTGYASGLKWSHTDNKFYFSSIWAWGNSSLFSVSLNPLTVTNIGYICNCTVGDVAFDSNGKMYALDISGSLLVVNKTTGHGKTIGSTGFSSTYTESMDWDAYMKRLVILAMNEEQPQLRVVNTTSGMTTLLCNISEFGYGLAFTG